MFKNLSDKLHDVFRRIRGEAKLTEDNISEALREIRLALLDADVNINVVKDFVDAVKTDCIGHEVIKSVTPGQQLVKIVHDRMVELLGSEESELALSSNPTVIMLVGLHGSGKTTTAGKLAKYLKKQHKNVLLVAGDVYRPAAIDQLEFLGKEIDVPVYAERGNLNVPQIALHAVEEAKFNHQEVVLIDTAGRLQIDEGMVNELILLRNTVRADEILLVADAALGQEAVSVAEHFNNALQLTGFILTKFDGDARGGAALSIRKVTGCPVKFVGTGEKIDDLTVFYPERMASRILGMGDVVSLVEKAASELDEAETSRLRERMRKNQFTFTDFLSQLRQISKLGGAEAILKLLPGGRQMAGAMSTVDPKHFSRIEAIILSMTEEERENPDLIDFSRRKRIARGSGNPVEQVSGLIKQFCNMRKMMKKTGLLGRLLGNGGAPELGAPDLVPGGMPNFNLPSQPTKKELERKRSKNKMQKKERQKQRKKKK